MSHQAQQWNNKRYQLLDKIGSGGMGAVYTAYDRLTQSTVALKRVLAETVNLKFASNNDNSSSEASLSLALDFRILAGLRHPHIVSVVDYGFDQQKQPYFVMEYVKNAQTIIGYASHRNIATKGRVLVEMLQALDYLHHRGILHRDLKPDNIMVTKEGQV